MSNSFIYPKAHLGKRFIALLIDIAIAIAVPIAAFFLIILPLVYLISLIFEPEIRNDIFPAVITIGVIYLIIFIIIIWKRKIILRWFKSLKNPEVYIPVIILLLPSVYYFTKDGFKNGQSFGKKFMGLMVVDLTTNMPCQKFNSFLRGLVFLILCFFMVGFVLEVLYTMIQNEGRRLGDFAAKTQVIELSDY